MQEFDGSTLDKTEEKVVSVALFEGSKPRKDIFHISSKHTVRGLMVDDDKNASFPVNRAVKMSGCYTGVNHS